ncbi:PD40 domain-containing protein [Thermodesulfobacterium thermophilum]|uniref:PD40 domain-containing protein n=1 Tax=Thermodesulfobacterium thermophilum TaxID=886 RepID=UPI0003B37A54|nr:PD40 domain-containing protein [Thermodesulfobacterium thermophilum]
MKFKGIWIFLSISILLALAGALPAKATEPSEGLPLITVESQTFGKILVRVPDFKGDPSVSAKLTSLLRRMINLHLFVLATPNPPFSQPISKEYYLTGSFSLTSSEITFKGQLEDLLEKKIIGEYHLKSSPSQPERLIYILTNKIIEDLSHHKGIAYSKVAFVKRVLGKDRLYLADFSKENPKELRSAPLILFPKFSPSGQKLAYLVYEKHLYSLEILNLKTGEKKAFNIKGISSTPVWSPDEKSLFLTIEDQAEIVIYRFSLENQTLEPILGGEGVYQVGDLSQDGKKLLYVHDKRTGKPSINLFDLETKQTKKISKLRAYNTSPRFSPKGDKVLYLSRGGGLTYLVLQDLATGKEEKFAFKGRLEDPAFSPTGDYLLASGEGPQGHGIYLIHLPSHLYQVYISGKNFLFPTWSKL